MRSHLDQARRMPWAAPIFTIFAAGLLLFLLATGLSAAPLEETSTEVYPASENSTLTLRNTDGTVHIYGSDGSEFKITARKRAYSKARLDGIHIKVSATADGITIDTVYPPRPRGLSLADRSGTVDYTILVPQTCTIRAIELVNGEVVLNGMRGPSIDVRLTNGRILAQNCFSAMRLTIENGGLDVGHGWWEERPFSLVAEVVNGDIGLGLPAKAAFQVEATTHSGWIRNGFAVDKDKDVGHSFNATIGDEPNADFKLRGTNGNIRILKE